MLPDLTFPSIAFGPRDVPWDMNVLLYVGASAAHATEVQHRLARGEFGNPLSSRLPLVKTFHEFLRDDIADGVTRDSTGNKRLHLRYFYAYADEEGLEMDRESITTSYFHWVASLHVRVRQREGGDNSRKSISRVAAYQYAISVGALIDRAFERASPIIDLTPLRMKGRRKSPIGIQAEKQNLLDTEKFGHAIREICDGLSFDFISQASFPLHLKLSGGQTLVWSKPAANTRAEFNITGVLQNTYGIVCFRIEAEFLMFIGQTGMNKTQALMLKLSRFRYYSYEGGYKVREYKGRKRGGVEFTIFKHYRAHLERYLQWRARIFPESTDLFPFVSLPGTRPQMKFNNSRVKPKLKEVGIPYITPQTFRGTRVNWLLRKTGDLNVTAEMAQHAQKTTREVYHRPSLQRAVPQAGHFWMKVDPALKTEAVVPGACNGQPKAVPEVPLGAPEPDCRTSSGCIWCINLRYVDSLDHVWGLSTFRHLKRLELARTSLSPKQAGEVPSQLAIERVTEILEEIGNSTKERGEWVREAELRMQEGSYHPSFRLKVEILEGIV